MRGWTYYRTASLGVFPYMPGVQVYRDGMLPFLYTKLKEEGKVAATFCGDNKTMDQFISFFDRLKTLQVLCEMDEPEHNGNQIIHPVGFSWIDVPRGTDGARVAMCGEAFFNSASKRHSARDLARLSLAYAMYDLKIDVFMGVQEAANISARNFAARLGWKDVAVIPKYHAIDGKLVDGRIMMLEATSFLPAFDEWFKLQPQLALIPDQTLRTDA